MVKQEKEVRIAVEYGKQCDCACRSGRVEVGAPRSRAQWSMIVAWLIGIVLALGEAVALYHAVPGLAAASWLEVKEQTACEAMQHNYCLGLYGFTIKHDGTFIAGPSDQGIKAEGRIEPEELEQLEELIGQLLPSLSSGERICDNGGPPGIRDHLDIAFASGPVVRAYDLGGSVGKLCYLGLWDHVRGLHEYLRTLMSRYYPVPFPTH
jgi:hypothetical protein